MSHPKIVKIELTPVHVPFREVVRKTMKESGGLGMAIPAEEEWPGGDFAICRLHADDGSQGLGEAFVWLPETGVTPDQLIAVIQQALAGYVLGESPFRVERIRHRMDANVARSDVAKGLLDMACYDLMGHITGRPACDFMGGACVDAVPLCALIPLMDVEAMLSLAKSFHETGTRSFRLKLGRGVADDLRIVSRTREALGNDVRLRVDYNQAYSPAEAVRAIRAIEPFGIDCAEQPVRAIGVVGLNSERPGGVTNALRAIGYAEQRGLGVVLHNQPLGIASAMHLHLAAARHHALGHAVELFGHVMFEDDLIAQPLDYAGGRAALPPGPGWGVELDEEALARYATGETVVLEAR
jgi:muconate cycloisomerase